MIRIKCILLVFISFLLLFSFDAFAAKETVPTKEWMIFLENLKKEMLAKGISSEVINRAYGENTYYHLKPEVVEKDKKQTEFILTASEYINRLVNAGRVENARKHHAEFRKKYAKIEEQYSVPLNYLTAFWAIETNFGQNKGKYHLIDSLTNLCYDNRRSAFFKNELYNVLKIMDKFNLENEKILGSWAGAMGHFQFMPSTFNAYAVDYDGDGIIDIWDSFDDAIASAANYLSCLGWQKNEAWGMQVELPWNFDYQNAGLKNTKSVEEWKKMGVRPKNGKSFKFDNHLKASVILPDGRKGPAYLVLGNFKRIMIWNRSENYALAVGILADYIASGQKFKPLATGNMYVLTGDDIKKVQQFANKILNTRLKEDGKLGPKTKEAVRTLQRKAKLHPDGIPDYQLLNKIRKYNHINGFAIPIQPPKTRVSAKNRVD